MHVPDESDGHPLKIEADGGVVLDGLITAELRHALRRVVEGVRRGETKARLPEVPARRRLGCLPERETGKAVREQGRDARALGHHAETRALHRLDHGPAVPADGRPPGER